MIKFITTENEEEAPTFGEVEVGQFFVSYDGYLCQKVGECSCNIIAHKSGKPRASHSSGFVKGTRIARILPKVTKIEF